MTQVHILTAKSSFQPRQQQSIKQWIQPFLNPLAKAYGQELTFHLKECKRMHINPEKDGYVVSANGGGRMPNDDSIYVAIPAEDNGLVVKGILKGITSREFRNIQAILVANGWKCPDTSVKKSEVSTDISGRVIQYGLPNGSIVNHNNTLVPVAIQPQASSHEKSFYERWYSVESLKVWLMDLKDKFGEQKYVTHDDLRPLVSALFGETTHSPTDMRKFWGICLNHFATFIVSRESFRLNLGDITHFIEKGDDLPKPIHLQKINHERRPTQQAIETVVAKSAPVSIPSTGLEGEITTLLAIAAEDEERVVIDGRLIGSRKALDQSEIEVTRLRGLMEAAITLRDARSAEVETLSNMLKPLRTLSPSQKSALNGLRNLMNKGLSTS
jgi:hypothetical protein